MSYALLGHDSDKNKIEVFVDDRLYHSYLVGSTGYGKTSLITNLVCEDAKLKTPKQGLLVLDPLGGLVDNILHYLPQDRLDDVILLQLDSNFPAWGMNLYECPNINDVGEVHKTVERVMRVWNKIFSISRETPLLSTLMRNLSYLIIFNPPLTMVEIPRVLHDRAYRQRLEANITYTPAKLFWERFDQLKGHDFLEQVDVVMRRFDEFVAPIVEHIVGQYKSTIDFRTLMDEGKIVLVKMNPEYPGASELVGSIMISLLLMAAYSRQKQAKRKQFNLYVDEFQNYATREFQTIYSEARQFGIGCLVSHQHRSQIPEDMKDLSEALMQASTFITLQTTPATARELSSKFDNTPAEPKMEEVGTRKKRVFVTDVVGHLMRVKHESDAVNRFRFEHLDPIKSYISTTAGAESQAVLTDINAVLYKFMTQDTLDTDTIKRALTFMGLHAGANSSPEHFWNSEKLPVAEIEKEIRKRYAAIITSIFQQIHNEIFHHGSSIGSLYSDFQEEVIRQRRVLSYSSFMKRGDNEYKLQLKDTWYFIDSQRLEFEEVMMECEVTRDHFSQMRVMRPFIAIKKGQEEKFFIESELQKLIQEEINKLVPFYTERLRLLREVRKGLHEHPILGDSGEEEVIYRPGQKDTPDQVRDKITNQIIHLPIGHARVRLSQTPPNIQSKVCHRCGTVNIKQTAMCQECKVFLRNEYLIELAKPSGNYAPNLDARIKRIVANNIKQGYLRKKEDVQREIDGRQNPSSPVKPAKDVRYCRKCGAENRKDAKFCRKCQNPFDEPPNTAGTSQTPPKQPPQPPAPPPMKPRNKIM